MKKFDGALLKITHRLFSATSKSETKVEIYFQSAKEYEKFFAEWITLVEKYKNKSVENFLCDECLLPSGEDDGMICRCGWKGHLRCAKYSHLECPEKF